MRGRHGKILVAVAGVGLSAVFLWLAVRNADLDAVRRALSEARLGLVLLAVLVIGVGYGFQAARWQRIAAAPSLGLRSFYGMVVGGLACNNVLPIRIGEILRAGWLSRDAPMPGGRAFGSVVLDRICDVVTLAVFFAIGLQAVASAAWLVRLAVGALLAVVVIALALLLARVYTSRREDGGVRQPRGRVVQILRDTVEMLGEPIGRRHAATWIGLTACTWTLSTVAAALVARSVGIELSPLEAVFLTSALALGVAIPSSPGYIGTYQWIGVAALGLLDVPVEQALAFAILMQASWFVPTTLAGGAFIGVRALRGKPVTEHDPSSAEDDGLEGRYPHRDDLGHRALAQRGALTRDAVRRDRACARAARRRVRGRVRRRRIHRRELVRALTPARRDAERRRRAPPAELREGCRVAGRIPRGAG